MKILYSILISFFLLVPTTALGQEEPILDRLDRLDSLNQELSQAKEYLLSLHLDSTKMVIEHLLDQLEAHDSVWYFPKGYQYQLGELHELNFRKSTEIEVRYTDKLKTAQLMEKEQQLQIERAQRMLLLCFFMLVILLSILLMFAYLKLHCANKLTKGQAMTLQQINEDLSQSLKHQILLQGEIHHRVKNNLQIIISLLELQQEDIEDSKASKSLEAMSNRIYSMAAIHEILYLQDNISHIDLFEYIEVLCLHFSSLSQYTEKPNYNISIGAEPFNLQTAMPLGIIITELLANSLKYARVEGQELTIDIGLKKLDQGCYYLSYKDNGPGFCTGTLVDKVGGLGTYLLKSMSRQLKGRIVHTNENGALSEVFFEVKT